MDKLLVRTLGYFYLAFNDIWKVAESPKATNENTNAGSA